MNGKATSEVRKISLLAWENGVHMQATLRLFYFHHHHDYLWFWATRSLEIISPPLKRTKAPVRWQSIVFLRNQVQGLIVHRLGTVEQICLMQQVAQTPVFGSRVKWHRLRLKNLTWVACLLIPHCCHHGPHLPATSCIPLGLLLPGQLP